MGTRGLKIRGIQIQIQIQNNNFVFVEQRVKWNRNGIFKHKIVLLSPSHLV